jgi:hypothetical protein
VHISPLLAHNLLLIEGDIPIRPLLLQDGRAGRDEGGVDEVAILGLPLRGAGGVDGGAGGISPLRKHLDTSSII